MVATAASLALVVETVTVPKQELVDLRREAHTWRSLHARAREREQRAEQRCDELLAENRELKKQLRRSDHVIEALKTKVKQYAGMLFGRKSEKRKPEEDPPETKGKQAKGGRKRPRSKRRRGKQPGSKGFGRRRRSELPTETIYHPLPEDQKACPDCGAPFDVLPQTEDSEEIDVRVEVRRIVHKREIAKPACSCRRLPGLVTAPRPPKLIPKGMFTVDFWAYVVVEKFLLQRPLSRVILQLAFWGLVDPASGKPGVSQGTLTGGLKRIWPLLQPLYDRILEQVRKANHWHMDETRWMVFAEVDDKVGHKWWLWVLVAKDTVYYWLDPSRSADVPRALLEGANGGILSVDRYIAYKSFAKDNPGFLLSFCWTHARREFVKVRDTTDVSRRRRWAEAWLGRIGWVFYLNDERLAVRSKPDEFAAKDRVLRKAVDEFKERAQREVAGSLGDLHESQVKILESILKDWAGFLVFIEYPDVPMDNSEAERQIRESALGRKNFYGSGAVWSGYLTAGALSILRTATRNGLNPRDYLAVYLEACANNGGKPPENVDAYLPWALSDEVRASIARKARPEPTEQPP